MNETRLMETLLTLCRIPSPSGREGRAAAYVRARLAALGLSVIEDSAGQQLGSDTGNLLVRIPGQGQPLFFSAHLDTVPVPPELSEIPLRQSADRLDTGGACVLGYDDKGGVSALLELAECAVARQGQARPLELIFTIQEERGLLGARCFDAAPLQARAGYVLDNEAPVGSCLCAQPAKGTFSITVHGKAAHAAVAPEQGINAIKVLGEILHALPTGQVDAETVLNLGRIEGGGALNVVPDRAVLTGELRSLQPEKLQALLDQLRTAAETSAAAWRARVDFEWQLLYPGYQVPLSSPCAQQFSAACAAEGYPARFERSLGGSDANRFNQKGLTCLNIGLEMNEIHSAAEYMRPSQLVRAVRLLERLIGAV